MSAGLGGGPPPSPPTTRRPPCPHRHRSSWPAIFCTRETLRPRADALADRLRVAVYDRRGRGASGGQGPVPDDAVDREVADLHAVIGALGGEASVSGHGRDHGAPAEVVAPVVADVLGDP